jgi:hypothetical protein
MVAEVLVEAAQLEQMELIIKMVLVVLAVEAVEVELLPLHMLVE